MNKPDWTKAPDGTTHWCCVGIGDRWIMVNKNGGIFTMAASGISTKIKIL